MAHYMTTTYDHSFSSLQPQVPTIDFKASQFDLKRFSNHCGQQQAGMPITPVHIISINPSEANNTGLSSIVEPIVSSNTMSPSFKSDDMPTLTPYCGQHNFTISIPNGEYDETKRKGQTCVFQTDGNGSHQLFTKPLPHYWRLNYSIDSSAPTDSMFIRLVPVYGDPEKAQCILERCPKHKECLNDENVWKNRSVILVEKSSATYFQDPLTKRVCVLLPFEKHAEGQSYSSVNCQFACYNSCFNQDSGGRKTLYLIITLEIFDNKMQKSDVIGRQCLQFRSCACPSRDWRDKKVKTDSDTFFKKEKRVKYDDKLCISRSTPINMGGKDAIIRVLPSLPGIDDAINALVSGYLFNRASTNGGNMETINEVFRQLKNVENIIIEKFTSSYDPNTTDKSSCHSPDSDLSNVNQNSVYGEFPPLYDNYSNYVIRPNPNQQHIVSNYPQNHYAINYIDTKPIFHLDGNR